MINVRVEMYLELCVMYGCSVSAEQLVGLDTRQGRVYSTITIISITAWSKMKRFHRLGPPPGPLVGLLVGIYKRCVMLCCLHTNSGCHMSACSCMHQLSSLVIPTLLGELMMKSQFFLFIFFWEGGIDHF